MFAGWCNSLGGLNGHKIKIDKLDAKITEYKQRIQEACAKDFALVGGGGVFDDAGQTDRLSCLLPDFPGYVVSNGARGAGLQVQATPGSNTEVQAGLFRYLAATFPDSIANTGFLTGNIATTINNKAAVPGGGAELRLPDRLRRPLQPGRRADLDAVRPGHQGQGRQGPRTSSASRATWASCSMRWPRSTTSSTGSALPATSTTRR